MCSDPVSWAVSLSHVDSGALDYSWSFNGVPFQSSDERTYTQDGTLTFQLTRVNVGKFACLASTSRGTVSSRPANVQIAGVCACACLPVCMLCVCVRVCVCVQVCRCGCLHL